MGPLVFKKHEAPRYESGFVVVVVTSVVAGLLALVYRMLCMWTNRQRDNNGTPEGFDHAYEDDLTDRKVRLNPITNRMKLTPSRTLSLGTFYNAMQPLSLNHRITEFQTIFNQISKAVLLVSSTRHFTCCDGASGHGQSLVR